MNKGIPRSLAFVIVLLSGRAFAFHVANAMTDPCHEEMTSTAFFEVIEQLDLEAVALPGDPGCWHRLAAGLIRTSGYDPSRLDDRQRFVLFSLLVGNRLTDTGGHSFTDMQAKRWFQTDRSDAAQYAHCLRGENDDGSAGDSKAVAGARAQILGLLAEGQRRRGLCPGGRIIRAGMYIDYYGRVEVPVHASWFLIGRALHTLQDTFSHTIRSERDDLEKIVTVMNFIDAVRPGHDETRDGLAHADNMDDCYSRDMAPLTAAAREASADFLRAVAADFYAGGDSNVAAVLGAWLTLDPECMRRDDRCGSLRWFEIARIRPSGDYLEQMIGCGPYGPAGGWSLIPFLLLALAISRLRHTPEP